MKNANATSIVSGYGIKPVTVDGIQVATVLKFAVRRESPLHAAYWTAFNMHKFEDRPVLSLQEQEVCKKESHVRLYCIARFGSGQDLAAIYREAQILLREFEICELKYQDLPDWWWMFRNRLSQQQDIDPNDDPLPI